MNGLLVAALVVAATIVVYLMVRSCGPSIDASGCTGASCAGKGASEGVAGSNADNNHNAHRDAPGEAVAQTTATLPSTEKVAEVEEVEELDTTILVDQGAPHANTHASKSMGPEIVTGYTGRNTGYNAGATPTYTEDEYGHDLEAMEEQRYRGMLAGHGLRMSDEEGEFTAHHGDMLTGEAFSAKGANDEEEVHALTMVDAVRQAKEFMQAGRAEEAMSLVQQHLDGSVNPELVTGSTLHLPATSGRGGTGTAPPTRIATILETDQEANDKREFRELFMGSTITESERKLRAMIQSAAAQNPEQAQRILEAAGPLAFEKTTLADGISGIQQVRQHMLQQSQDETQAALQVAAEEDAKNNPRKEHIPLRYISIGTESEYSVM